MIFLATSLLARLYASPGQLDGFAILAPYGFLFLPVNQAAKPRSLLDYFHK